MPIFAIKYEATLHWHSTIEAPTEECAHAIKENL